MRVVVLNGSPNGKYSVTLQSVLYLRQCFREDSFEIIEIASRVHSVEEDLGSVLQSLQHADLILFSYPVYIFLVPYQLHRVMELVKESGMDLRGKCVAQLSTSKHFFDVTAHRFIEENVRDLGMRYLKGFSADMDDLLTPKGQHQLRSFWRYIHFLYEDQPVQPMADYDIAIVTDSSQDPELRESIEIFRKACPARTRVIEISDVLIKGGCLGCLSCASEGVCVYNDGFPTFVRTQVLNASALVYAFRIKDHSMGSRFKLYDDRQFCNGHRMMTMGMPMGYIVKGDLSGEANLRMLMEARAQVGQNILCRIVNEKDAASERNALNEMAREMIFTLNDRTSLPQNFYGVGGMKIFRDLIWLMRGLMKADHRFYRKQGIYDDLPHRHLGKLLQFSFLGMMFNNKSVRKKLGPKMNEGKIMAYRKVVEKASATVHPK